MSLLGTYTSEEKKKLELHGLSSDKHSMCSDSFVLGCRSVIDETSPIKEANSWLSNHVGELNVEIAELREFVKSAKFTMEKAKNHHPSPEGHDCEMLRQQVERACELLNK